MFDWFKNKDSKVVNFPKRETNYTVTPTSDEKPATIFYRFGVTDKNRLAFQMGYSEITMNKAGCQNLINQLTFFMNQLEDEDEDVQ